MSAGDIDTIKGAPEVVMAEPAENWKARAGAYLGIIWILPSSVLACWYAGDWADRRFGTSFWGLTGTMLGLAAGFYETIRQTLRIGKHGR